MTEERNPAMRVTRLRAGVYEVHTGGLVWDLYRNDEAEGGYEWTVEEPDHGERHYRTRRDALDYLRTQGE